MSATTNTKAIAPINIVRRDQPRRCVSLAAILPDSVVPLQPLKIGANVGGMLVAKVAIFLQTPC